MFPEDLELLQHFDSIGMTITGYPWAGDTYHTYSTRNNPDREGNPLFGHGPEFGYFHVGTVWYGDELWDGGSVDDLNDDGEEDDLDRLIWIDSVADGRPFRDWTPFDHPELGEVEIGGFHPKFFSQNGPPEVLDRWAGNQARFNFYLAQSLPDLEAGEATVQQLEADADSTTWEVRVPVTNNGRLPTALRQAQLVKAVRPDEVRLSLEGVTVQGDDPDARFVEPSNPRFEFDEHLQPGQTQEAVFTIRTYGDASIEGSFEVLSTRGGVLRGELGAPGG